MTSTVATNTGGVERAPTISLSCTGCGAVVDVEAGHRTAICIYCETPGVIEKPRDRNTPEPAFVLPWDPLESTCRHASLSIL